MISWNQLIFICGYEFHARKVCNSSMDKPFEPRERYVCIFFEILVPGKGGRKGVRPLLYESWWLNAKFGKKIDIRGVADDIYSIMRSNQCSGNPPPFPHPFSDHVEGRANAMVNRYPWYSGIFFILGVTTEIEGSIKTPRTPFLHHHKVQDQSYILWSRLKENSLLMEKEKDSTMFWDDFKKAIFCFIRLKLAYFLLWKIFVWRKSEITPMK